MFSIYEFYELLLIKGAKETSNLNIWLEKNGEKVLRSIGIEKGQDVLDFGCGSGNYTIPAAKIVEETGKVYALDKDEEKLNRLRQKAKSIGLENIEIIKTSGELKIPLGDRTFDVILFYDILHNYYFSLSEIEEILKEAYRISRPNCIISVYPKHMEQKKIIKELEDANFYLDRKYFEHLLIHNDNLEEGEILNFKRGKEV